MAKKEFTYKGKTLEELQKMSVNEFGDITCSEIRRVIKRGFTPAEQALLKNLRKDQSKMFKTHCRDMIILPEMINRTILVHSGKEFLPVKIAQDMLGHRLGEFILTRRKVSHSAPGIGATKSSSAISVK